MYINFNYIYLLLLHLYINLLLHIKCSIKVDVLLVTLVALFKFALLAKWKSFKANKFLYSLAKLQLEFSILILVHDDRDVY